MNYNNYIVIMAGGVGSRFWPQSRNSKPKQFLDILGTGKTLIQSTVDRFKNIVPVENIYVITNEQYGPLTLEQLPELSKEQIICEPSRKNTAPCIAYVTYKLWAKNIKATIAVVPADHLILDIPVFLSSVATGFSYAEQNEVIVTLGVQPTRPDTGYGYIQFKEQVADNVFSVSRFAEKPSMDIAKQYLESKEYLWNAGIFIASAQSLVNAYKVYASDIHTLFQSGMNFYNTPAEFDFIDENYAKSPYISFDYAIAEKAENVFTIPVECGWSDLGTWASLYSVGLNLPDSDSEYLKSVMSGSLTANYTTGGIVKLIDTGSSMISIPKGKVAVINGLNDYIIVDTKDALLIWPKSKEQEIKTVTENFKKEIDLSEFL